MHDTCIKIKKYGCVCVQLHFVAATPSGEDLLVATSAYRKLGGFDSWSGRFGEENRPL